MADRTLTDPAKKQTEQQQEHLKGAHGTSGPGAPGTPSSPTQHDQDAQTVEGEDVLNPAPGQAMVHRRELQG